MVLAYALEGVENGRTSLVNEAEHQAELCLKLIRAGQYALAHKALNTALQQGQDNPDVLIVAGYVLHVQTKISESEPYFREALRLDQNRAFTHARLGLVAAWKGRYDDALVHYRKAIEVTAASRPLGLVERAIQHPDETAISSHASIIDILFRQSRLDDMETAVTEALQRHPRSIKIYMCAVDNWIRAGEIQKALEILNRLILSTPDPDALADALRKLTLCRWINETLSVSVPKMAKAYEPTNRPPLVISITVWGDSYVQSFLDPHLRSLAAPGNIPALAEYFDIRFTVVTTEAGRDQIKASGAEEQFSGIANFDYFLLSEGMVNALNHVEASDFIYQVFFTASHVAIAYAQAINAAISFSVPDTVVADGSFGRIGKLVSTENVEGVFAQAIWVAEEGFVPEIRTLSAPEEYAVSIEARDLMRIGAKHLHPTFTQRVICPSNRNHSRTYTTLFWWGEDSVIAHIVHWLPILISAKRLQQYKKFRYVSIDGELPEILFPDPEDWTSIHLVTRSDEFGFLSTFKHDRTLPTTGHPFDPEKFSQWYNLGPDLGDVGRWMFRYRTLFQGFVPQGLTPRDMTYPEDFVEKVTGKPVVF